MTLPEQNEIIAGRWFSEEQTNGIFLSDEIAERYKLKTWRYRFT